MDPFLDPPKLEINLKHDPGCWEQLYLRVTMHRIRDPQVNAVVEVEARFQGKIRRRWKPQVQTNSQIRKKRDKTAFWSGLMSWGKILLDHIYRRSNEASWGCGQEDRSITSKYPWKAKWVLHFKSILKVGNLQISNNQYIKRRLHSRCCNQGCVSCCMKCPSTIFTAQMVAKASWKHRIRDSFKAKMQCLQKTPVRLY